MRLNYANPSFSMVIWAPATFLMILQDGFCIATIATIATRRPLQPWHSNHWSTYSPSQSTARVDVSWALESKGPTTCPDRLGQWPRWKSPDPIHPGLKRSQERNWSKHWSRVKQGEAGWSRHVSLRQDKSPKACQKLCQNKCWHKCHEVEQFVISWAIQGQENSGALYLYLGVSCLTSHHWALALAALV